MKLSLKLKFDKGYIAEPYWPEREKVISIRKAAGVDRARTETSRRQALAAYLSATNMTAEEYAELEKQAQRPFYTWGDVSNDHAGNHEEIVISAHQLYGALAQTAALILASIRIARPENLRTVLTISDFATGKFMADAKLWERYVTVKSGTGAKLSNQRSLRQSYYIEGFIATGHVEFIKEAISLNRLQEFIAFCGREVGVGASRKMG